MTDASRAAGVVEKLLNPASRTAFAQANREAQAAMSLRAGTYHEVEIKVQGGKLKARTVRGYYS